MTTDAAAAARNLAEMGSKQNPSDAARAASVVAEPPGASRGSPPSDNFLLWAMATSPSPISDWGVNVKQRDMELRGFISTESFFASALSIVTARNAAMDWSLTGDEAPVDAAHLMLANANFGRGLEHLMAQTSYDLYTQDTGAFVEIVRERDAPDAMTIGINHLDAARCHLTGNPEVPVLYNDSENRWHEMKWYQVVHLLEMPSPLTPGKLGFDWQIQYCALTRVFHAAQVIKDTVAYKAEKVGGRYERAIHLIRGVTADEVRDAMTRDRILADADGRTRYITPPIVGSMDPRAEVGHDTIDMASLPDGFNEKESLELYLLALSMGFLTDYQEFAPLPGGGLGTSAQSEVLHQKARGKGPGLFRTIWARTMNMHGVLPDGVEFEFDEQDIEEDQQVAEAQKTRGEARALRIQSTEIDARTAQVLAVEAGDMTQEQLDEQIKREEEEAAEAEANAPDFGDAPFFGGGDPAPPPPDADDVVEGEERPELDQRMAVVTPDGIVRARAREDRVGPGDGDEREEFEDEAAVVVEGALGAARRLVVAALRKADDGPQ